jgi:alkylation response protein AidB-like acyl-CoA dehydrogenase
MTAAGSPEGLAPAPSGSPEGLAPAPPGEPRSPAPASRQLPDLGYQPAEEELRAVVRRLLAERGGWQGVLARAETGEPTDTGLWHTLAAELGCAGLLIPQAQGGAGAGYREAAVVAEETGYAAACVPYLGSAVMATAALLEVGDELLTGLASGAVTAALAAGFTTMPPLAGKGLPPPGARVGPPGPGGGLPRLTGSVASVADALAADILLVPADGVPFGLYAVGTGAPGVRLAPVVSLDTTRPLADLELDAVPARPVATGAAAVRAVAAALTAGAGMLACEQLGTAQRCLDLTLAYVKERKQFARPVGSFQALKHRLADVWVAITQARAAARYAAACLADGDPDTPVAVALAKAACGEAAVLAAQECVQLHGGIGFTWEHPAHLFLKRAKSGSLGLGSPDRHRAALADLVGLPPAPGS